MSSDIFRVTDAWADPSGDRFLVYLDLEGIIEGGEQLEVDGATFAMIAMMMAYGKPVYYSRATAMLSTDPSFGEHPHDDSVPHSLRVISADPLWNLRDGNGKLMLTLQNRGVAHLPTADAGALAGWALTIKTHRVKYDGQGLESMRDTGDPGPAR